MLGVGSVVYLPVSIEAPLLDNVLPNADDTGAMLPDEVAPALAFSQISLNLIHYPVVVITKSPSGDIVAGPVFTRILLTISSA